MWKDNIKMDFKEIWVDVVDLIYVAQERVQRRDVVKTVLPGVFLRRKAVPEVLSQKDVSRNGVPELFSGIGITNTTPSPIEFWVTRCVSEPFSKGK
jgi:hypothetical protein